MKTVVGVSYVYMLSRDIHGPAIETLARVMTVLLTPSPYPSTSPLSAIRVRRLPSGLLSPRRYRVDTLSYAFFVRLYDIVPYQP